MRIADQLTLTWFGKSSELRLVEPQGHCGISRCLGVEGLNKIVRDRTGADSLHLEIEYD
jgi:hypothetical protein